MPDKTKRLVIIGAGEFAEIACEYFTHDSAYDVVAFAVERQYLEAEQLMGRPIVAFEDLERHHAPGDVEVFVGITNTQLNRVRARLYAAVKLRGYTVATYVSSRAFVWHNAQIGENSFIFENNVIQYHVRIGNNCVLWSGNHVGHRTVIRDHVFITSHAVISGYCDIGEYSFIGVNASIGDHVTVGRDATIGMGAVIVRPAEAGKVYVGNPAKPLEKSSYETWKVPEDAR